MSYMQPDLETGADSPTGQRRPVLRVVGASAHVVIADSDAARRAGLLDELTQTMPEVTAFFEVATMAQLLAQAAGSRLVILGGPLEDAPTASVIRRLGQRFPDLHVINMETPGPSAP